MTGRSRERQITARQGGQKITRLLFGASETAVFYYSTTRRTMMIALRQMMRSSSNDAATLMMCTSTAHWANITSFSVEIIELVKYLKSNRESVISNQIGRSGTSIGTNIYEANYAQGRKDFISKWKLRLKKQAKQELNYHLTKRYKQKSLKKPQNIEF